MKNSKEHWNENFYGQDLRGKDFSGHFFYKCIFTNAVMDDTTHFKAAVFENCNLSSLEARGSKWEKSIRMYCNLNNSDLSNSKQKGSKALWCDLKSVNFEGADLRNMETDFSRLQYFKFNHKTKFGGWSREIIAEILRQGSTSLRMKQFAAWIKEETQLCWEQFMLLQNHEGVSDVRDEAVMILQNAGFGYLIENGGRLCQTSAYQKESH